ncbi:MAG: hypothetical protein HYY39_07980 [Armatimonadetes bacterium]|nr:hypothetical protein [Armatimonadota bacterium]MBI2973706.1 hypothetical protein [Armatimonadota bacterium]
MRTTLTLDDDVAAALKAEVRRAGRPFKAVVNELLRAALHLRRRRRAVPPFTVRARSLGTRPGLDYDRTAELVEHLEGPLQR